MNADPKVTHEARCITARQDYVWEVLAGCKNADFVEDDKWTVHKRDHLSFTVTSETLGVYAYITRRRYRHD